VYVLQAIKLCSQQHLAACHPMNFFKSLDPVIDGFVDKLYNKAYTASEKAGNLSKEGQNGWAFNRCGLSALVLLMHIWALWADR
jgi:hypothetical protein